MSAASINKIHVTNSTRLSLNDRFTAFASHPEAPVVSRRRSRSRSSSRSHNTNRKHGGGTRGNSQASTSNRLLLQQLARRHKMQTALKLKRRSMRQSGGNGYVTMKRGSIKALRVAANGRPIKTNSLTTIATMNADFITNRNRPVRRSSSNANIAGRLGARRPSVGGAAERIAKRQSQQLRGRTPVRNRRNAPVVNVNRSSRSRSRARAPPNENANNIVQRGRSLSRGRGGRSRSRGGSNRAGARNVPVKARLGLRPNFNNNDNNSQRGGRGRVRTTSITRRGVATGRIQKRRNSTAQVGGNGNNQMQRTGGTGARMGRARGRSVSQNGAGRSRSRTRRAFTGQQQQQQQQRTSGSIGRGRRRGQSQQRIGRAGGARVSQRNGKTNVGTNGQQTQPRRGRSRSRGGRGGRNLGKVDKLPRVNKDELDKELDQYMATTKTENNMDYLLKN